MVSVAEKNPTESVFSTSQERVVRERLSEIIELIKEKQVSRVICLDQSARPLGRALMYLWKQLEPDSAMPAVRYLNVGQEKARYLVKYLAKNFGSFFTYKTDAELDLARWLNGMTMAMEILDRPEQTSNYEYTLAADTYKNGMHRAMANMIPRIMSQLSVEQLETIFGEENIAELKRVLKTEASDTQPWLILDDLQSTSSTSEFVLALLEKFAPGRTFLFETLITDEESAQAFTPDTETQPYMPWSRAVLGPVAKRPLFIKDDTTRYDRRFVSRAAINKEKRQKARRLYRDLKLAFGENKPQEQQRPSPYRRIQQLLGRIFRPGPSTK